MASWPKRSQNCSPGSITRMPIRGALAGVAAAIGWGIRPATSSKSAASAALGPGIDADHEALHAPAVGATDAEMESAEAELLAGLRQVADRRGDQAADGVVLVVGE